jgi:predicted PurR-regulated permease PerM
LAREIVDRRKKLAAGLSVALIVMLVAFPVVFFFHSAFVQGKQLVNRGLHSLQSGEMAKKINDFYEDEKTQQTLKKIQNSSTGNFLLQELADFLDSPELFAFPEDHPDQTLIEPDPLPELGEVQSPETPQATDAGQSDDLSVIVDLLKKNLLTLSRKILSLFQVITLRAISAIWGILFSLFLMVIVLFFVFYKGRFLLTFFRQVGPFAEDDYQQICDKIEITAHTVFVGIMGAALVQGLASMVGFWLTGLPALFLAVLSAACSIIPFVGTALVWFPASLYLFFTGHPHAAIFLCAWGLLLVGNIDGIVRPWLMSGGKANLSFGVLFFSILGGLRTYGLIGIIYGPMLIGIFITVVAIFAEKYKRS